MSTRKKTSKTPVVRLAGLTEDLTEIVKALATRVELLEIENKLIRERLESMSRTISNIAYGNDPGE